MMHPRFDARCWRLVREAHDKTLRVRIIGEGTQLYNISAHLLPHGSRRGRRRLDERDRWKRSDRDRHRGLERNDALDLHFTTALLRDAEAMGGGVRKIDHASRMERASIVHSHDDAFTVRHTR